LNGDFLGFLGLAARAGRVVYGSEACETAIRRGKIKLLLVDGTTSEKTLKEFIDACTYYKVPIIVNKAERTLGEAVGKPANKVIGISCPRFAGRLMEIHKDTSGGV